MLLLCVFRKCTFSLCYFFIFSEPAHSGFVVYTLPPLLLILLISLVIVYKYKCHKVRGMLTFYSTQMHAQKHAYINRSHHTLMHAKTFCKLLLVLCVIRSCSLNECKQNQHSRPTGRSEWSRCKLTKDWSLASGHRMLQFSLLLILQTCQTGQLIGDFTINEAERWHYRKRMGSSTSKWLIVLKPWMHEVNFTAGCLLDYIVIQRDMIVLACVVEKSSGCKTWQLLIIWWLFKSKRTYWQNDGIKWKTRRSTNTFYYFSHSSASTICSVF